MDNGFETFFTIITPTVERGSLSATCASVDKQTFRDWEHLIQVDSEAVTRPDLYAASPWRSVEACGQRHNNFGNTCRHTAWARARGKYIVYLDDDNFLLDEYVLENMQEALTYNSAWPKWALFPILRYDQKFFNYPPRVNHVDTANVVVAREFARWPSIPDYTADGQFIESISGLQPHLQFPDFRPMIHVPVSSYGAR